MTTTNMFLNFGGKWDSPPLGETNWRNAVIIVKNKHAQASIFIRLAILIRIIIGYIRHAQSLFGLWTSLSLEIVTKSKGGRSCLVGGVLL